MHGNLTARIFINAYGKSKEFIIGNDVWYQYGELKSEIIIGEHSFEYTNNSKNLVSKMKRGQLYVCDVLAFEAIDTCRRFFPSNGYDLSMYGYIRAK